ncbi:MAG: hypothetical protein ABIU09_11580 [Pyrinomonadaceae bacterium]
MTHEAHIRGPVRVSILERLVPSLGFATAAISGAIGSALTLRFLSILRQSENAGLAAFFGGLAEVEFVVGLVLVFAAALCAIGILIPVIRLFTTNKTASPPGLLFLVAGLLSLVPPFALHYVLHLMKEVVRSPDQSGGGVGTVAGTVTAVAYFAIGSAGVIALLLLAFAFVPFSSLAGRKALPIVCLMLVEILIAVLSGVYFWEARHSLADRDRDSIENTDHVSNSLSDANSYDSSLDSIANEADST